MCVYCLRTMVIILLSIIYYYDCTVHYINSQVFLEVSRQLYIVGFMRSLVTLGYLSQ